MRNLFRWLPALLVFAGITLLGVYFAQPVYIRVDGQTLTTHPLALTVKGTLRQTGVEISTEDLVIPPDNHLIPANGIIEVHRAVPVHLLVDGQPFSFLSVARAPAALAHQAGFLLFPGDVVLHNGAPVNPIQPIGGDAPIYLQIKRARPVRLVEDGGEKTLFAIGNTLRQALWQAGVPLLPGDVLSPSPDTPLSTASEAALRRARPITIEVDGKDIQTFSAAPTVGAALAEAGLSLQGLDRTEPDENSPLPADGRIRVVRVREEIVLQQKTLPFSSTLQPDSNLPLDERRVIQPGKYGVQVSRERVRYEDGVEIARFTEGEWTAAEPVNQVVGYGTQVRVQTAQTPDGTIEYYRKVTVYATSYSPCQQGLGRCSWSTSSGMRLQKGVVAVTLSWYRLFKGARVYIPGYGFGVIGDVGGGIPGTYWVDLGYSEEDYVRWSQNVEMYFLTPAPPNPPAILP